MVSADRRAGLEAEVFRVERGRREPVYRGTRRAPAKYLWNAVPDNVDVRGPGSSSARVQGGDGRRRRCREVITHCPIHV